MTRFLLAIFLISTPVYAGTCPNLQGAYTMISGSESEPEYPIDRDEPEFKFSRTFDAIQDSCEELLIHVPYSTSDYVLQPFGTGYQGGERALHREYQLTIFPAQEPATLHLEYREWTWLFGRYADVLKFTADYRKD